MKKCEVEMMKKGAEIGCRGKAGGRRGRLNFRYALRKFHKDCENFATLAKISQSLRKFRYAQIFAIIAKITMHSKNLNFAMPGFFRYDGKFTV